MKCRNDIFMSKVGVNKLDKAQEVHFDVQRDLPDCRKINVKNYLETASTTPVFNKFKTPANQFECMRVGCVNSGTLFNEGKETKYRINFDATEFSAGVITFYALLPQISEYSDMKAIVKLSNAVEFTDAWKYEVELAEMNKGSDGFVAVVVDLTKVPAIIGNGWIPMKTGAYLSIELDLDGAGSGGVGISSITIFDDINDFETSSHVIMSCLTSVDGTFDFEAAEATCFGGGYNTDDLSAFEKTVTGKALTPNYMLLNPMAKKNGEVQTFDLVTVQQTLEDGVDYAFTTLLDMDQAECGFFSAAIADACDITDAQLERLSIPSRVDVDEKHYQLIDNGDGTTTVLFHKDLIGQNVNISYPKIVMAEEYEFTEDVIGDARVRMSYTKTHTDGVKYRFVFNNVLITSVPDAISQDETEFAFTVSIQKDSRGKWGYAYRILN